MVTYTTGARSSKMKGINFDKQYNLIDMESLSGWQVKVFGLGSIGSILVKQLALVGVQNIIGYDYDTVDEDNIGSQEYRLEHIGMKKTDAIQKMMKGDYNFDMGIVEGEITEETEILPEDKTLYFCAFDSLEARKILWDKLKTFPVIWGESRIGLTSQRLYFVDLRNHDEKWIQEYEETLNPEGPRTELKCGEKGTYPSNTELVGKVVRQIVNIFEGNDFATQFVGDWGMPPAVFNMPIQVVPTKMDYN